MSTRPVPGCTATGYLEVHHKVAWSRGGATDLINLMCLCPAHHDAVHRGEYVIEGDPDAPAGDRRRLIFTDTAGHRIGLPPPTVPPSPLPAPQRAYRKPYGERLNRDLLEWHSTSAQRRLGA